MLPPEPGVFNFPRGGSFPGNATQHSGETPFPPGRRGCRLTLRPSSPGLFKVDRCDSAACRSKTLVKIAALATATDSLTRKFSENMSDMATNSYVCQAELAHTNAELHTNEPPHALLGPLYRTGFFSGPDARQELKRAVCHAWIGFASSTLLSA